MGVSARKDTAFSQFCKVFSDFMLRIKLCESVNNYWALLYKNREKECNFAAEIGMREIFTK